MANPNPAVQSFIEKALYTPLHIKTGPDGNPVLYGDFYELHTDQDRFVAYVALDSDIGVGGTVRRARLLASASVLLAACESVRDSLRSARESAGKDDGYEVALLNRAIAIAEGRREPEEE